MFNSSNFLTSERDCSPFCYCTSLLACQYDTLLLNKRGFFPLWLAAFHCKVPYQVRLAWISCSFIFYWAVDYWKTISRNLTISCCRSINCFWFAWFFFSLQVLFANIWYNYWELHYHHCNLLRSWMTLL